LPKPPKRLASSAACIQDPRSRLQREAGDQLPQLRLSAKVEEA
jgi:hypothetical protein